MKTSVFERRSARASERVNLLHIVWVERDGTAGQWAGQNAVEAVGPGLWGRILERVHNAEAVDDGPGS